MKTKTSLIIIAALLISICATACQTSMTTKNNAVNQPEIKTANNTIQPEVKRAASENQSKTAGTETGKSSTGLPSTPTDVYKTAFAARENKDVSGLKKVLSKKMLDFFTDIGKFEQKTLDEELKQLTNAPQAATAEVRSEKISGDKATLEYLDEKGNWKTMDFVKESDGWKMTLPDKKSPFTESAEK